MAVESVLQLCFYVPPFLEVEPELTEGRLTFRISTRPEGTVSYYSEYVPRSWEGCFAESPIKVQFAVREFTADMRTLARYI